MGTIIYNKAEFLKQIEKIINDDEYVVFSDNVIGAEIPNEKDLMQKIAFGFTQKAFSNKKEAFKTKGMKFGSVVIVKKGDLDDSVANDV